MPPCNPPETQCRCMSTDITLIAHVIQLAVAPVFLLSGIAALLNVLNNRLAVYLGRARRQRAHRDHCRGRSARPASICPFRRPTRGPATGRPGRH